MSVSIEASDLIIDESNSTGSFTVRLQGIATTPVSVDYRLFGSGTAKESLSSGDFNGADGTLTFDVGVTELTVSFNLLQDLTPEPMESFLLHLLNPVDATIANTITWATIIDNDNLVADTDSSGSLETDEKAELSVRDVVVDEKAGTATFDLILSKATTSSFNVAYSTAAGSALAGSDFTATSGVLTFAAGQTSQQVTVDISDDAATEKNEYFQLNLGALSGSGASQVLVADGEGMALIGDNDLTPQTTPMIRTTDIVLSEGDGYGEFVVQLDAPGTDNVSVDYGFIAIGTADAGSGANGDFVGVGGTLNFTPGVTTQTVRFELNPAVGAEKIESAWMRFTGVSGGTLADTQVWATIIDDDTPVTDSNSNGTLDPAEKAELSVRDMVVDERAGTATFDLVLSKAPTEAFQVAYSTAAGTASAGSDFTAASGTVGFASGQTSQRITVNIVDDAQAEKNEYFHLNLGALSGSGADQVLIADETGTALIGGNDQTPQATPMIHASNIVVSEGDGYGEFVIQLDAPGSSTVTVDYSFFNFWTATNSASNSTGDYIGEGGRLHFAPGVTTQTVRFELNPAASVEDIESFQLRLSRATDADLATADIWATIIDDDRRVTDSNSNGILDPGEKAELSVLDLVVDEKAGTATFNLVLSKAPTEAFRVTYSTAAGTAEAGSDFGAASGTIGFAADQTSQRLTVDILDDVSAEQNEYFYLNLGALSGSGADQVLVTDAVGMALIGGNDQTLQTTPVISASDIVVSEGDGYGEFVVQLDAPSSRMVEVKYAFLNFGVANGSSDFNANSGTLRFAPGTTTQTLRFELDPAVSTENIESLYMKLSSAVNATIANDIVWGTIIDDDTPVSDSNSNGNLEESEKARLSVRDVIVDETAGTATFDLILSKAPTESFSVEYETAAATASGADFTAASGSIGFSAGQTSQSVTVTIIDDANAEGDEYFHLKLGDLSGAGANQVIVEDGIGAALIGANDQTAQASPLISVSDIVVSEDDGYGEFVVQLDAPGNGPVSVRYGFSTFGQTATLSNNDSGDFTAAGGTLHFAPGVTTQTVRFEVNPAVGSEDIETFLLNLSRPTGATIADGQALGTIIDDDMGIEIFNFGLGDDVYRISNNAQYIEEVATGGIDLVYSSITYSLVDTDGAGGYGGNVENLTLTGNNAINGTGNALDNILIGNSAANRLVGNAGADTLDGRAGNDHMLGGTGNDIYIVDTTSDRVTELAGQGSDLVRSSISYSLVDTDGAGNNGGNVEKLTLTGNSAINGTGNVLDNLINGNNAANILKGLGGNDTLIGNAGNDVLDGGSGKDSMSGGAGNDTYIVDNTTDVISELAGQGSDLIKSSVSYSLADTDGDGSNGGNVEKLKLTGSGAIDSTGNGLDNVLTGNSAANTLRGLGGDDRLVGNGGKDVLDGGAGNDVMLGGKGNDVYIVDSLSDILSERSGQGSDLVRSSVSYSLVDTDGAGSNGGNIEKLTLTGTAAINGTGNALNNILVGNAATNRLTGNGGNDKLNGLGGNDILAGGTGNDVYIVNSTADIVSELKGQGSDLIKSSVSYSLVDTDGAGSNGGNVEKLTLTGKNTINATGNALDNVLNGNGVANKLIGKAGNDTLVGKGGKDILNGGTGNDSMAGGKGNDVYIVDSATDIVIERSGQGSDLIKSSVSYSLVDTDDAGSNGGNVEKLKLTGSNAIDGTGNGLNNLLTGNGAGNRLTGNAGNDKLIGGGGKDLLDGGAGKDKMLGGKGNDTYVVNTATDIVIERAGQGRDLIKSSVSFSLVDTDGAGSNGGNVEKLKLTGSKALNGTGNGLDNVIKGNASANKLNGKGGNDKLVGNGGNDLLNGDAGNDILKGGAGQDILNGGAGKDKLTGNAGNDVFAFTALSDMSAIGTKADIITDFERGQDKIDLSALDANTATNDRNEAFDLTLVSIFTEPGQLMFDSEEQVLFGNTDLDETPEFAIQLTGISVLSGSDIIA